MSDAEPLHNGSDADSAVSLDSGVPVDPEQIARALGAALRRRHDRSLAAGDAGDAGLVGAAGDGAATGSGAATGGGGDVAHALDPAGAAVTDGLPAAGLGAFAARLVEAAEPHGDAVFERGPYLGRSIVESAQLAVETVAQLPPQTDADVGIVPDMMLGDCRLDADGTVRVPEAVATGDRHLDLAAAAIAIGGRHGPAVVAPMFDAYGFDVIDVRRLDTSQLLVSLGHALAVSAVPAGG